MGDDTNYTLHTLPFIHNGIVENARKKGENEYNIHINRRTTRCMYDGVFVKPLALFPSKNYVETNNRIGKCNKIGKLKGDRLVGATMKAEILSLLALQESTNLFQHRF